MAVRIDHRVHRIQLAVTQCAAGRGDDYAYVNPILAVILGAAISGEALGWTAAVANVLIVGAMWLALTRSRSSPRPPTALDGS